MKVKSLSQVRPLAWTTAYQAPLSMGFSRQEYWSGVPLLSPLERLEISSRKLEDINGTFHAKMGTIKDRNSMDLTEAEDIKKRWQEYTDELSKKDLMTQIIMMV